jgi:hypothetical protein
MRTSGLGRSLIMIVGPIFIELITNKLLYIWVFMTNRASFVNKIEETMVYFNRIVNK